MKRFLLALALLAGGYPLVMATTYYEPYKVSHCAPPTSYSYYQPVSQYVPYPVPIYGSVYVGPQGASNVQTTITQTTTATGAVAASAGAVAGGGATVATASGATTTDVLRLANLLDKISGQLDRANSKIDTLAARQDVHEQRTARLEGIIIMLGGKLSGPPIVDPPSRSPLPPVLPPKLPPAERKPALVTPPLSGLEIANESCAACHKLGNHIRDKGKEGIVLLRDGKTWAPMTQALKRKVAEAIVEGKMPPAENIHKIGPLTKEKAVALIKEIARLPDAPSEEK